MFFCILTPYEFIASPTVQPGGAAPGRAVNGAARLHRHRRGAQVALLSATCCAPIFRTNKLILPRKQAARARIAPSCVIAPPGLAALYHSILARTKPPPASEKHHILAHSPVQQCCLHHQVVPHPTATPRSPSRRPIVPDWRSLRPPRGREHGRRSLWNSACDGPTTSG